MHSARALIFAAVLCAACGSTESGTLALDAARSDATDATVAPDRPTEDRAAAADTNPATDAVNDASTPTDVPPTTDVPVATDTPPTDVTAPADVTAPTDATPAMDAPATSDVPAPPDAPVATDVATTDGAADAAGGACARAVPACNAPPPSVGATVSWRHFTTRITIAKGAARHRGRDLFLRVGDPQWAIAKFAYGFADDDLNDEDVEVYLLRDCARWESLGTLPTSVDASPHATVYGVADDGGRLYVPIPESRRLGVGTHRVHFVVRGDHSVADALITVLPADARVVVSDVDGTQTESENAALLALLTGPPPMANPGGAEMLTALAERGYYIFYLTARPEWLATATHDWLNLRGYPPGLVHTTLGLTGATGSAAAAFKIAELTDLTLRFGRVPDFAFGNTDSDVAAYTAIGTPPLQTFYYRFTGDTRGGQRVDDYTTLVPRFRALPRVCR